MTLLSPEEHVLSTLESDGSRRWMYPRLSMGRFWKARRIVAYLLIAIFTLMPVIPINRNPAVFLDLAHRRFHLLGFTFLPTDTILLALLMVSSVLGIFFFTALFGRVWCGWACPQTVYMEFLIRPLERLCYGRTGRGGPRPAKMPFWRTMLLYVMYLTCCLFLAHTFLSYFVGIQQLRQWMMQSPIQHPGAFLVMAATTGLMMFDFCYFREQTCMIACPYGRFQSVLLDRDSLIITYDPVRGEPRGPLRKSPPSQISNLKSQPSASPDMSASGHSAIGNRQSAMPGDCIDCNLCVQVCPTGIDIRNGLQLECIACTQCIDACDDVMAKLKRPLGLIRYSSESALAGHKWRMIRPRLLIYLSVMAVLLSALAYLFLGKGPFDAQLLRNPGRPFVIGDDGMVANEFRVRLTNRIDAPLTLSLAIADHRECTVHQFHDHITLPAGQMMFESLEIKAPASAFAGGTFTVKLRVTDNAGYSIDRTAPLIGPFTFTGTTTSTSGDSHGDHH